jgi:uncharacterized protein (AIM24 family)
LPEHARSYKAPWNGSGPGTQTALHSHHQSGLSSFGGIIEIDVTGEYVVDTGNIVAFTDGLNYNVTKVGGYKSLFFSREGFVCRFSGQGRVWIQTRKVGPLVSWVWPFRPSKK